MKTYRADLHVHTVLSPCAGVEMIPPLIVQEALMIEPTETENKDTLDTFIDAMLKIAEEAHATPDLLHDAPHNTPFGRLDEIKAAKELILCCWLPEDYGNQ